MEILKKAIMWLDNGNTGKLKSPGAIHTVHKFTNGDEIHVSVILGPTSSMEGTLKPNRKKMENPQLLAKQPDFFGNLDTPSGKVKMLGWFNLNKARTKKTGIRVVFS